MIETRLSTPEEEELCGLRFRISRNIDEVTADNSGNSFGLLVHGRAGTLDSKLVFGRPYVAAGLVVIVPEAPLVDPMGGFSWWGVGNKPGSFATSEDLEQASAYLSEFLEKIPECFPVLANKKIIASGFSQGAGLLSHMSISQPEQFLAVALLSGFIPRHILDDESLLENKSLPDYFMFHGTKDQVLPFERTDEFRSYLEKAKPITFLQDDVGHKVSSSGMRGLKEWLSKYF